jgi:hypothetical protein
MLEILDARPRRRDPRPMPRSQTLAESLTEYTESVPEEDRLDALHQLFYGFYSRIAVIDRTTHELARWAKDDLADVPNLSPALAEALRDNALHVGRDLFGARMRAMAALRIVSAQLAELRPPGTNPAFTQRYAVAFDEQSGSIRTYDLARPGEHPDLPYDPFTYDPAAED